ncbi:hypothetical protein K504DRAFT_460183 [Pleomassaria siparia CBS 279.74]|uniref:Uncharacterized protein n=1 Tax=Pleomassaria siparia CBS 279.74 TaxID=1314801 RepID=A0A6G1JXU3_9PLEO|nr:hypothetical protein K504DRAFT_460183 [Pleomassaria siparia CBS 279.74]
MQLFAWLRPKPHRYGLVQEDKDDHAQATGSPWCWLLNPALVCLLVVASFFMGRNSTTRSIENSLGRGFNQHVHSSEEYG